MRRMLTQFLFIVFSGLCALFLFPAAAGAQTEPPLCAAYPRGQDAYECQCPPMSEAYGSVWGSGPYTADSDICMAALHYGVIGLQGGAVVAYAAPGQDSYDASFFNGVQSSSWGAYDASFLFESIPLDPIYTDDGIDAAVKACAGFPDSVDQLTCSCTGPATTKGEFWGNDPYTSDSDVCGAARHSGLIDEKGGVVTVLRAPGLEFYSATVNNGVESMEAGYFFSSFVFDRN